MALDSTNVRKWAGNGAALVDLTAMTATLPVDATAVLDVDFESVGYLSDSGVTISENADTSQVFAWQNGANVRTVQSTHDVMFAFEMLETNEVTLEVFYGSVEVTGSEIATTITGEQPIRRQWVLQAYDDTRVIRIVLPEAQVTERGDVSLLNSNVSMFPVTLTAYPDSDGNKAYIYMDDIPAGSV